MLTLNIKPTKFTPMVVLDAVNNKFEISGESRPEDAAKFYDKILRWLNTYFSSRQFKNMGADGNAEKIVFEFKIDYFNSKSAKYIADILFKIGRQCKTQKKVNVKWYYEKSDVDIKEAGERLSEMVKVVPFEFKEY